jgi:hypothetical protein
MKALIFQTPWTIWRWIRLASGVIFLGSGVFRYDPMIMAVGAFFAYQAIFNASCCSGGVCAVPGSNTSQIPNKTNDL